MQLPVHISIDFLKDWSSSLEISEDAINKISTNRAYLDNILQKGETYYGINTGFGSLCNVKIEADELACADIWPAGVKSFVELDQILGG